MNKNQIAFIIYTNNKQYYNECIRYIKEIEIPEGYEIDIIEAENKKSLLHAFNIAMKASSAKYKVYLHQDTFIINRMFLHNIISIFNGSKSIGMIGVCGIDKLPENINSEPKWNIGQILTPNNSSKLEVNMYQDEENEYQEVEAIDGVLIATQYDLLWREDILNIGCFYDISHSLEMKRKGYKIVIPYQKNPWCYHDYNIIEDKPYCTNMKYIFSEYPELIINKEDLNQHNKKEVLDDTINIGSICENLIKLLEKGEYEQLTDFIDEINSIKIINRQIQVISHIVEIYCLEKSNNKWKKSQWSHMNKWEDIYKFYLWVKFLILRTEFDREDERFAVLKEHINSNKVSNDTIYKIACMTLNDISKIYEEYVNRQNEEQPLVSVFMAVYNAEDFINKTIDSILYQTYQNIELIIVDDASTDRSRRKILSYDDKRIIPIFLEKNMQVCNARNVALKKAKGKYVAYIDHDDVWNKNKIMRQVNFMEQHPSYGVCFTWADNINENDETINERQMNLHKKFTEDNYSHRRCVRKLFFDNNYFCSSSALIRKKHLEKTGLFRYALLQYQDYDLWLRLLREAPVYILQEKLTYYRIFENTLRNLGSPTQDAGIRGYHERQWILDNYIEVLTEDEFIKFFGSEMKNPLAQSKKDIMCEKAFLLWDNFNCFAVKRFIELYEDDECRKILEEKCKFELKDFYKINGNPLIFDSALVSEFSFNDNGYKIVGNPITINVSL